MKPEKIESTGDYILEYDVIGGGVFERRETRSEIFSTYDKALSAFDKIEKELSSARLRVEFVGIKKQ